MEPMVTNAEAWLLAADREGFWLAPGDRVGPVPVSSDGDPWYTARLETARLGVIDPNDENFVPQPGHTTLAYVHGSSGRPDVVLNSQGNGIPTGIWVVTHLMVVDVEGGCVPAVWPQALPVSFDLLEHAGQPYPHGPTTAPVPRDADVLWHSIGHAAWLGKHDSEFIGALARIPSGPWWVRALEAVEPVLAKQYRLDEREAWLRLVREHTAAA